MKTGVLFHIMILKFRKGIYFKSYFSLLRVVGSQLIRISEESQGGDVSRKGHILLNMAQIFGITYSIIKHVKKRITYETGANETEDRKN